MKELLNKFKSDEATLDEVLDAIKQSKTDAIKERLDSKNEQIDELKGELKQRDEQITELKSSVQGNEELTSKISQLEEANSKWEEKYKQTQIETAIKLAAKDANDPADVLAFVDKGGLALKEDGTVDGLEDALKTLRESKSYLFKQEEPAGLKGRKPNLDGDNPDPTAITREKFNGMSYQERVNLYNTNLELYNKLSKGE